MISTEEGQIEDGLGAQRSNQREANTTKVHIGSDGGDSRRVT